MKRLMIGVLAGLMGLTAGVPARAGDPPDAIDERVVTFDVTNTNDSMLACPDDKATYELVADLVMPAGGTDAITVLVHGASGNHWRYGADDGVDAQHDLPARLAERGHATLALDLLGYHRSDKPDGTMICIGGHASVVHQIVEELRAGLASEGVPPFERVFLLGHSSGGFIAELAAYSFRSVDGLVMYEVADVPEPGFWAVRAAAHTGPTCATGGEVRPNYSYTWGNRDELKADVFYDIDDRVWDVFDARIEPDPCADRGTVPAVIALGQVGSETLTIPMLVVYGEQSNMMDPWSADLQCRRAVLAPSCAITAIPHMGHGMHLERNAPAVTDALDTWLSEQTAG